MPGPGLAPPRKPPAPAQYNWLTESYQPVPQQEELPFELAPPEECGQAGEHSPVQLLATENGAQLLVCGHGLSLGKKSERVTIKQNRKLCGEVPLFRLQEIVVEGRGISLSTDLIEETCARGIRIALLSPAHRPVALLTSPFLTATVATRRAQLEAASNQRGVDLIRWIVAGKLHNQEKLLRYFGKSREGTLRARLAEAAAGLRVLRKKCLALEAVIPDEARPVAMGFEGAGARIYWAAVADLLRPELGFRGRVHDQPADPVNAGLNYGYGILYSHVWGAVMNAGLEPFAGFLHADRAGKPSMVLDLVEEFRQAVVDRPWFSWLLKGGAPKLEKGLLDSASREEAAGRVLARLNAGESHRGRTHQVRSIIQMQARLAAAAVRGLKPYRPFAFKW